MRLTIILGSLLLTCSACAFSIPADWGSSTISVAGLTVEHDDGVFTIDGVELRHSRWVDVVGPRGAEADMHFSTATEVIELGPSADAAYALQVLLYSEVEGDGEVALEGGRLVARSTGEHKLLINAVKGKVPDGLALNCESGMGNVKLAGFSGGQDLGIEVGMGSATLTGCSVGAIAIKAGMGGVDFKGVNAGVADIDAGMGGAEFEACNLEGFTGDFGMGSVTVRASHVARIEADIGMGSMTLVNSTVDSLSADLGMGDLVLKGTARPRSFDADVGLGSVFED